MLGKTEGHLLLEGGAEFGGKMAEPDRRAIELAGGFDAPICIIPTAAAPDHNDRRAGQNGVRWFNHLGAEQVIALPLIDPASANQPSIAIPLRRARLIYLLGGFPRYLGQTLANSLSWQSIIEAYQAGAVVGGSSAGAMVLCEHYYDPETQSLQAGANLVPNTCVIPHHDTFGKGWSARSRKLLPGDVLIGIDEQTGMIDEETTGAWMVYGKGVITLYREGRMRIYQSGEVLSLLP